MPTQSPPTNPNPFDIITPVKPKKVGTKGILIAVLVTVFLGLGTFVGVLLVRQNQNVEEMASTTCVEQCPGKDGVLRNCTPPDADGTSEDSTCNVKGRVESCGGQKFCCPAAGGTWSTNLASCATPTPTATVAASVATATATATSRSTATATSTARSTATATSRSTATATATARATATAAATKPPVPQTGTEWPTYMGMGLGVITILGSLFLAL